MRVTFKFDFTSYRTYRMAALGEDGVLLSDSTNAEGAAFTNSERSLASLSWIIQRTDHLCILSYTNLPSPASLEWCLLETGRKIACLFWSFYGKGHLSAESKQLNPKELSSQMKSKITGWCHHSVQVAGWTYGGSMEALTVTVGICNSAIPLSSHQPNSRKLPQRSD